MANERLRAALLTRGETPSDLADVIQVDPKTVERWIGGRVPHRRHRYAIATHLQQDESYLWPGAIGPEQLTAASESEILAVHPHRWTVPRDAWTRLFSEAEEEIDILVIAGLFLAEDAGLVSMLRRKVDGGVQVRMLIGDPDSEELVIREGDEGIEGTLPARVRNVLKLFKSLTEMDGVELRLHATTLYNSIFRADDEMLVNTHVYGVPGSQAPVMHLKRVHGGEMVTTYLQSFEQVWATARPADSGG